MNNYQITEVQKHNLEIALKNAEAQIRHLEHLLQIHTCIFKNQETTDIFLNQIQSNAKVLDNLNPIEVWVDMESDVQTESKFTQEEIEHAERFTETHLENEDYTEIERESKEQPTE